VNPLSSRIRLWKWLPLLALVWPGIALSERGSDTAATPAAEPGLQLQVKDTGKALQIKYSLRNGSEPILVYNRLLRLSKKSDVVRDTALLHRYIAGSTLRLFLGHTPDNRTVGYFFNVPHVTKLAPHATLSRSVRIPTPVSEYNDLLPEVPKFAETQVNDVVMFIQYVPAKGVKLERSRLYPDAFDAVGGVGKRARLARSNSVPLSLKALRLEEPADFLRPSVEAYK